MLKLKKGTLSVFLLVLVLIVAGCGKGTGNKTTSGENSSTNVNGNVTSQDTKLKVQVSFYPMYEFTKHVAGDLADVEALIPAGTEPHDWEPTPQDIKKIAEANVLVYNGAGLEGWVDQVVAAAGNDKLVRVEASHGLNIMEGTEEEDDHDHAEEGHEHSEEGHDHGEATHEHNDDDHDHGTEEHSHDHEDHDHGAEGHHHDHGGLDPHVWLSPALAIKEVRNIQVGLTQAAPEHSEEFKKNADAYVIELEQLDKQFRDDLSNAKRKDFITQHAAFGYLAKEYGLTQVPIAGLSPEQEPSAEKMADIVKFAKANNVKTIFFETLVSSKVADIIAKEVGAQSAVLNPIEGLTEEDIAANENYITIMQKNLAGLKKALNE